MLLYVLAVSMLIACVHSQTPELCTDEESKVLFLSMPVNPRVTEDSMVPVTFNVSMRYPFNNTEDFSNWNMSCSAYHERTNKLKVINGSHINDFFITDHFNISFLVEGVFIGFDTVQVTCHLNYSDGGVDSETCVKDTVEVGVLRKPQGVWAVIIPGFMAVMVALNYTNMGVQLDLQMVKNTLKRPIAPAIGFFSQFTVMPLAAYGYGLLFLDDPRLRFGLFALGCTPGGNSSNFWTLMFNGDINLSITMTFISAILGLGMMPLWIYTLGQKVLPDKTKAITIPYDNLFISLISLTAPLLVGIFIKYKLPRVAAISRKIIRPMTIVVVLVGMTIMSVTNYYIYLLFTWKIVAASFAVVITGYSLGAFFAFVTRLNIKQIIAVSIETAFQNSSVVFVIVTTAMSLPESELVVIPVIVQLLLTQMPLWFILLGIKIKNKCFPSDKFKVEEKEGQIKIGSPKVVEDQNNDIPLKGVYVNKAFNEA